MPEPVEEYLFRYEDGRYSAGVDEFDNPLPGYHLEFRCRKYKIIRRTPKGVWIEVSMSPPKFILLTARKRFACPTKLEALESIRARKHKYNQILNGKIAYNNDVLQRCDWEESRIRKEMTNEPNTITMGNQSECS